MKLYLNFFLVVLFCSCNNIKQNSDILVGENLDTLQVIRRYPSKKVREIIYYVNNKPQKNIGFTEKGDTIITPTVIYIKPIDSLFFFVPIGQFKNINLLFGYNKELYLEDIKPKYILENFNKSDLLKPNQKMIIDSNTVEVVFECINFDSKNIDFYPFKIELR